MKFKSSKFIKKLGTKKPEILFVAGIGCVIAGVVTACVASFKERDEIEEMQDDLDDIKARVEKEEITEEEAKRETIHVYVRTSVATVKHYALPVIFTGLGIASLTQSHHIIKADLAALGVELTNKTQHMAYYRKNVIKDAGKEKDLEYMGVKREEVETVTIDEGGVETTTHKTVNKIDETYSKYAKFFDESCRGWSEDASDRINFLKKVQCRATDRLRTDGFLFLNDVYEMLGIEKTVDGQQIGWLVGKGDDYVDLGLNEVYYDGHWDERKAAFVNGRESVLLLDFNVYGYILNDFPAFRRFGQR